MTVPRSWCADLCLDKGLSVTKLVTEMNTRFSVAVHVLTLLQTQPGTTMSSEWIAGSVNTNPSLIRRLLSQLAKAGLTTSQMGTGGGARLARAADTITLADVYAAVAEDREVLLMHDSPNPKCPVGRNIQAVLKTRIATAERALMSELGRNTICDLAKQIVRLEG
jgi:Rrf2 family protein